MNHFRTLTILLPTMLACGEREAAPTQLTLEALAAEWSGGRHDPTCRNRGPRGEYLGSSPGAEYCQWPTVSRGAYWGTVSGSRDSLFGLTALTWERVVADSAAAATLADSLGVALIEHGLVAYTCPNAGHRWQTPGFGVQFDYYPAAAAGRPKVLVFATVIPSGLADLTCPGVPTLPLETPRRRRSTPSA